MGAQAFHFFFRLLFDCLDLAAQFFKVTSLAIFKLAFKFFKFDLNDLLHLADMLRRNHGIGICNNIFRHLEDQCLFGWLAHLFLELFFQFLTLFNNRV